MWSAPKTVPIPLVFGVAEGEVVGEEAGEVAGVADGERLAIGWACEGDGDGLGVSASVTPLLNRSGSELR